MKTWARIEGGNVAALHYYEGEPVEAGLVLVGDGQIAWPAQPVGTGVLRLVDGALQWIDTRTLADVKVNQIALMKYRRDAVITGGFTWGGSRFDSDETSQTRILGAFVAAQAGGLTSVTWRLADNSWRTLSAADLAGVWAALQAHVQGAFGTFAALEAQINAATTLSQVLAVQWP